MEATATTQLGREYLRVSKDKSGRQRSVDEQADDNKPACLGHGIQLGQPYVDNDRSASRYAKKTRDGYDRLVTDLKNGTFGADVLVLWESSRGSRKVGEWVTLIDLLEEGSHKVFVTTHGRLYDPANGRDRRTLLEDAVDSEYDSYKTSARIRRTLTAQAAQGRPHGIPAYGYRSVYDPRTGDLVNREPHPVEAPVVLEMFQRLQAGHSQMSIAQDLTRRGIRNRSGTPFTGPNLRSIVLKPAYIAKRVHHGQTTDAIWPMVCEYDGSGVSRDEFTAIYHAVQRRLLGRKPNSPRGGRATHELSRIIRCGPCGAGLSVYFYKEGQGPEGEMFYGCPARGCCMVGKKGVDELVMGAMLAYLASDKVYADFAAAPDNSPELVKLRARIAELRGNLAELEEATPTSLHETRLLARAIETVAGELVDLEAQEHALTMPSALRDLIQPGADVERRWKAAPISARREIARLLLSPDALGEVRIKRVGHGGRTPARERVEWRTTEH